jgi:hypothetical protein
LHSAALFDLGPLAGWSLPVGSDVVLCYVFGTWVFGKGHPALHLLLLMAIAFDILGLLAMAIDSAAQGVQPLWLGIEPKSGCYPGAGKASGGLKGPSAGAIFSLT